MNTQTMRATALPVMLAALLLGTSCGSDDTSAERAAMTGASACAGSTETSEPAGPVPLTVQWEGPWDDVGAPAAIERWDDSRSDVEVTVLPPLPPAASVQALLGTDPPALARVPADSVAGLAKSGAIQALEPCVDSALVDAMLPAAQPLGLVDGARWGVPTGIMPRALLVDRNALTAAGSGPDASLATLADLQRVAEQLRAETGMAQPIAGLAPQDAMGEGDLTSEVPPGAIAFEDLALAGLLIPAPEVAAQRSHPVGDGTSAIEAVNASQLWGYGSALAQGQSPAASLEVAPLPGVAEPAIPVIGDVWVVSSKADPRQLAAAGDLVDWLLGDEQQALFHTLTDELPVSASAADEPVIEERWREIPLLRQLWDQVVAVGRPLPAWLDAPGATATVNQVVGEGAFEGVDLTSTWPDAAAGIDSAATVMGPGGDPDQAVELMRCLFPALPEPLRTLVACS